MASAEFLEQALSTNVDENAVNAIVGSLENQLVTSVSSVSSQNNIVNVIPSQNCNITSNAGSIIGNQKYIVDQLSASGLVNNIHSSLAPNSSVSYNNVHSTNLPFTSLSLTGGVQNSNEPLKVIYSHAQPLNNPNGLTFSAQSLSNGCIGQSSSHNQIYHAVTTQLPQQGNKALTMQPPLVIKQGANTGQVGMQPGMVTVPMTVNSSMPASIPNVMTLNKPGGQNVVVTTQNLGSAQPAILPNVQILNMRTGTPAVATQKSVATVSPRVVIGTPQVVGTRATAPVSWQSVQFVQTILLSIFILISQMKILLYRHDLRLIEYKCCLERMMVLRPWCMHHHYMLCCSMCLLLLLSAVPGLFECLPQCSCSFSLNLHI